MKSYRIFVEKYPEFRVEAESLLRDLNANLNLSLDGLRLLNVYDLFGFSDELLEKSRYRVFGEVVTDAVTDSCDLGGNSFLAVECLPGQFDQRAASAVDCVRLIDPSAEVKIKSSKLLIFPSKLPKETMERIRRYYINAVESREKDLRVLDDLENAPVKPVPVLDGFREMEDAELDAYCKKNGLAMNADDLREVVKYFRNEGRDPFETELRILDTYWSDHCRHTTFTTELENITVEESFVKDEIEGTLALYLKIRRELGREGKSVCLMDLATIGARYLRSKGLLDDLEVSEENNACSVFVDVDVDGRTEKWLLQFKNETHNHPTEIEPFGGASTCLGGAIRDPLSGRSYVYQAMRVTGAGNIYQPVSETLPGKLPQRVISLKAAAGYSSYGNQIGLATTHVREVYHPDYVAKRLEVGAVVGAVKAENVRRESPVPGDVVLLLGGRTGRDGVGGATGSSKEHTDKSLEMCGSEVQKGNAPEERKLERLFRRPEVTRLIKKSNDFGAGGVSVAIGELTDGLDIYLDRVPTKYSGLNATEAGDQRVAGAYGRCDRSECRRGVQALLRRGEYRSDPCGGRDGLAPYADVQQGQISGRSFARVHRQRRGQALCPGRDRCGRGTRSFPPRGEGRYAARKDACEPGGRQCPLAEGADRDVRFYDRRFDRAAAFRRSYATFGNTSVGAEVADGRIYRYGQHYGLRLQPFPGVVESLPRCGLCRRGRCGQSRGGGCPLR